jgi:pectate lyase
MDRCLGGRLMFPSTRGLAIAVTVVVALIGPEDTAISASNHQGFGALTRGGEGGVTVRVTTLADSGPGSLRAALRGGGHRTIVFGVAGDIVLLDYLYVTGPFVTIDGATAPPPGITLRNRGLIIRGNRGARDVIVRGIRVRDSAIDGIQIAYGAHNVVVDHVSVTGSRDGNIDITEDARNITVSWSILGGNKRNMLVKYRAARVTLHHNLFTESVSRNPQVRIDDSSIGAATETTADVRNNVIANWGAGHGTLVWFGPRVNVVSNYYSTAKAALKITSASVHADGNQSPDGMSIDELRTQAAPFPAPTVDTQSACAAAALVLADAGARPLDTTDAELVQRVVVPPPCRGGLRAS